MFSPTLKDKLIIQPGAAVALAPAQPTSAELIRANDSDVVETDAPVSDANLAEAGQ